jgi:hypothetical protein
VTDADPDRTDTDTDTDTDRDTDRDRDRRSDGRPRNARPRDALGRPLPRSAGPAAAEDAPAAVLSPLEAVARADELLRARRPFHAHEVLEDAWKQGPPAERDLWQGLAQIAVGLTHAHRGNARGAVSLLTRGAQRAGSYRGDTYGIDLPAVLSRATTLADTIERDGLDGADLDLVARLR